MQSVLQDLRYALRLALKQPGSSAVALLTLALGIGATTALFSVIDAALLRPLPYPHPEELVSVLVAQPQAGGAKPMRYDPSLADIRTWRGESGVLSHIGMGRVAGFQPLIVDAGTPERLTVGEASEDFLDTYGILPTLGRSIQAEDTRDGAPAVAVLGHRYWQSRFAGDPSVLGRVLRIGNVPVTIVGILPAGFYDKTSVWQAVHVASGRLNARGSGTPVVGRLRSGVSLAHATRELDRLTGGSAAVGAPGAARVELESLYDDETSGYGSTIRTLTYAVGMILIIACVNVAGLLLARGATRHVELAVRASIGAGRARLVRQLLTESGLLALGGALLGVLFAWATLDSLVAIIPLRLPSNSPATINLSVLTWTLGLSAITALLFGLLPALRLSRVGVSGGVQQAGASRAGVPLPRRLGQLLIGTEVALALVLLSGSGLLVRSFARLVSVDVGFDPATILTMEVEPIEATAAVRNPYYPALTAALAGMPEIAAVGAIDQLGLLGGGSYAFSKTEAGVVMAGPQRTVLPGYFEALGVRATAGRLFEGADLRAGEVPVVVNATAASQYFGGAPLGRIITTQGQKPRQMRIVGVVPNLRHGGPADRVQAETYVLPDPNPIGKPSALAIVLRLRDGAAMPYQRLEAAAESIGPRVLVDRIRPGTDLIGQQVATPRHRMMLLSLLGGFGLVLTLVGIFSMTAYAVARRTREIGIRMAFGARPTDVVRHVVRDTIWPVLIGLAVGLGGAFYATRILAAFLFETTPHDPGTLAGVITLVAVAACVAAWIPARRAAKVEPVIALRAE